MKKADKHFCEEYVKNGNNGTQAYLSVHPKVKYGTAKVMAHKLLNNEEIKEHIEQLQDNLTRDNLKKINDTIHDLYLTKDFALGRQIDIDDNGNLVECKRDLKSALKAIELILKMNGMLVDKQETKMDASLDISIEVPKEVDEDEC